MALRTLIRAALPAAALVLGIGLSLGTAASEAPPSTISTLGDSPHAALLNAGTVLSGLAPDRSVGLGVQTLASAGASVEVAGVEVSGITVDAGGASAAAYTESTTGEPSLAALLNMATSLSGRGPSGAIARGVTAFAG